MPWVKPDRFVSGNDLARCVTPFLTHTHDLINVMLCLVSLPMSKRLLQSGLLLVMVAPAMLAAPTDALRVGVAEHAFDHLGDIGNQAEAAAASGANIIYCTALGTFGYQGLPGENELAKARQDSLAYDRKAKAQGIRLTIGYVCATSIVRLDKFDEHWSPQFRAQFHTSPAAWRQLDKAGRPLPSWYGGEYQPACMNNPDWRAYEKCMVRWQLESGQDGIFFDNPTVHPDGCYCRFCLEKFAAFLVAKPGRQNSGIPSPNHDSTVALRDWAIKHPAEFMEFRSTIARDFLADMRRYARTIKPNALITCNNSLNSSDALFAQCRQFGYNINELSQAEDFILVEDMSSQPRTLADGRIFEYGPTYEQLHAISHGKPVVAVNLADADYHTPPNLVRLAMAEAAAHDSSYLLWPTWPENVRQKMSSAIRPETDFLRRNEKLLNDTRTRRDVLLFLCFRRWLETENCAASALAAALSRANVQFTVTSEDDFEKSLKAHGPKSPVVLIESFSSLNETEKRAVEAFQKNGGRVVAANEPDWLASLQHAIEKPAITLQAPATVRAVVRDQRNRTLVHLYNLNIQRVSSFEDKVNPAQKIRVTVRVPFARVHSVAALTADSDGTSGPLEFTARPEKKGCVVEIVVPKLEIASILTIE